LKRILITGATGFIGGRLAEVAFERGILVSALVHTWSYAVRLARLPVRMIPGDILDPISLRAAMKDCDVVFHCAIDNRVGGELHRRSSVEGTANVMQAALEEGVKRVVHLSSIAVYGYRPGRDAASEDGLYRYSGDAYCDGKIDGEKVALRYYAERGLPVTVLRPTIVYGPFGPWTIMPVGSILRGRMVIIDGGKGICNCLFIDNLVEAMLLAAELGGSGEIFHISDARPVTWREFLEAHARALGDSYLPLPQMTTQEIKTARAVLWRHNHPSSFKQTLRLLGDPRTRRALRSISAVEHGMQFARALSRVLLPGSTRRLLRKTLSNNTSSTAQSDARNGWRPLLSENEVNVYTVRVVFSIEKARSKLGYNPRISFAEGMERTTAWIRWAQQYDLLSTP